MIRRLAALALAALPVAAAAQSTPPKLIVAISVDQFSADLFAEYRAHFIGGLKRLSQGVVFPSGYQSHAATETCPGHSTILTGARPARTGIIANKWYDASLKSRADQGVYCAEDESLGKSSASKDYVPSPLHLLVPTLGDRMKAVNPASRVVAVAGKDRAAIMMGGHNTDQIWFLNPRDYARFETLPDRAGPPPAAAARANAWIDSALAKPKGAWPLSPLCKGHARPVAITPTKSVGDGAFARAAGDKKGFRASPDSDLATITLAGDLVSEMKLGKRSAPDLIAIGMSGVDVIGHYYGTEGSEMCTQVEALDHVLGAFFARLDKAKIDYAVVLTADHGGHDIPERNRQDAIPEAQRTAEAFSFKALDKDLARELGVGGPVLLGTELGDVWFSGTLTPDQRKRAEAYAIRWLKARPEIAAVFTADDMRATAIPTTPPETWTLAERARASFYPGRSGDLIPLTKPRFTPIPLSETATYIATHGSAWDYDRRVPILFWRKGMAGFEQPNSVETVDILPTLAPLIGLTVAKSEIDGRCLDLIAGPATSCPAN